MLILDTTAFYAGVPYSGNQTHYTTFEVIEEVLQKKKRIKPPFKL